MRCALFQCSSLSFIPLICNVTSCHYVIHLPFHSSIDVRAQRLNPAQPFGRVKRLEVSQPTNAFPSPTAARTAAFAAFTIESVAEPAEVRLQHDHSATKLVQQLGQGRARV